MGIKNIPVIIDDIPGLTPADKEQLSIMFENTGRKLLGLMAMRRISPEGFKIYLDNGDPIPAVLQEKTAYATDADQNIVADSGYDALSKVVVKSSIVLSSIAKATDPTTTTYIEGQVFDKTGLTATATYSNGATRTLTASDLTAPTTPLAVGTAAVTISFVENNVSKTFTVPVTVNAKEVSSIAVKTAPTKTAYTSDDNQLTMAGLVITATYNNSTTEDIPYGDEGITYNPAEGSTVTESGNVTITYASKTCTQAITYS